MDDIIPEIPVDLVIMHGGDSPPDLDSAVAMWFLRTFFKYFPGIVKAGIEFCPQGPPPDERSAEAHEKERVLYLDTGEGRFDHHPHGKCPEKCATDLVADHLMVSGELPFQRILGYINMHDLEGPQALSRSLREFGAPEELIQKAIFLEEHSLASVFAYQKQRLKRNPKKIIEWLCGYLTYKYQLQMRFWTTVKEKFLNKANIWHVSDGEREYKIATIESDTRGVGSFSRTKDGGYCDVCIHKESSSGNVFISGNITSDQFLRIAKILRVWEMKRRNILEEYSFSDLVASKMELCPIWYLPRNSKERVYIIMNGGSKTKGSLTITPTVLPLSWIEAAVARGLDEQKFSDSCPRDHCLSKSCGWFPFLLGRCIEIRNTTVRQAQIA